MPNPESPAPELTPEKTAREQGKAVSSERPPCDLLKLFGIDRAYCTSGLASVRREPSYYRGMLTVGAANSTLRVPSLRHDSRTCRAHRLPVESMPNIYRCCVQR